MKYTREQLNKAQRKWNIAVFKNPEKFDSGDKEGTQKYADRQVDCLLSYVK